MTSLDRVPRADARRSQAAILRAAIDVLSSQPDASIEAIAGAAGLARQTVYAHFPSRERLLSAVLDQVTKEAVAEIDAAGLDEGPAPDALVRLLEVSRRTPARYSALLVAARSVPGFAATGDDRHTPVADRLTRLIERGQREGEFDDRPAPAWLAAATIALAHAASELVDAQRLSSDRANEELRVALGRLLGAELPVTQSADG